MEFIQSRLNSIFSFNEPAIKQDVDDAQQTPEHPKLPISYDSIPSKHNPSNTHSPALLSPAIHDGQGNERPPFKPVSSDNTSLSMITRRKHRVSRNRRREMRTSVDPAGIDDRPLISRASYRSLPNLNVLDWLERTPDFLATRDHNQKGQSTLLSKQTMVVPHPERDALPKRSRRWTLPSKAPPSRIISGFPTPRGRAQLMSKVVERKLTAVVDPAEAQGKDKALSLDFGAGTTTMYSPDTPAMITLRRATMKYSIRPYPESRKNLKDVSDQASKWSFFRKISLSDKVVIPGNQTFTHRRSSVYDVSRQKMCMEENHAFPCCQPAANTALTAASTESTRTDSQQPSIPEESPRRSSMKITSGTSVHEIIWEDHWSPSRRSSPTTASTSRSMSCSAGKRNIRDATAFLRLQRQLKVSDELRNKTATDSIEAAEKSQLGKPNDNIGQSLRRLLSWGWAGPQNSRTESASSTSPVTDVRAPQAHNAIFQGTDSLTAHADHVDFFPPLPSQRNSPSWLTPSGADAEDAAREPHILEPDRILSLCPATQSEDLNANTLPERIPSTSPGSSTSRPYDKPQVAQNLQKRSTHNRSPMGSSIGISSHVRRRSADQGSGNTSLRYTSPSRSIKDSEQSNIVGREPYRRHSSYMPVSESRPSWPTPPSSSCVQDFIARYEAQQEAARKWNASSRKPSSAGIVRLSRVNTLGEVQEEVPTDYRSLRRESDLRRGSACDRSDGQKSTSSSGSSSSEGNSDSVSIDWIG